MQTFDRREAARLTGISVWRLRYWEHTSLLKPSLEKAGKRFYGFADLVILRAIKQLLDAGISLQRVRRIVSALHRLYPRMESPLCSLSLFTDGEGIFVATSDPQVALDVLRDGQLVWKVPVGSIARTLRNQMEEDDAISLTPAHESHGSLSP
jgi:DNA-binding transcriptional MerR regulator